MPQSPGVRYVQVRLDPDDKDALDTVLGTRLSQQDYLLNLIRADLAERHKKTASSPRAPSDLFYDVSERERDLLLKVLRVVRTSRDPLGKQLPDLIEAADTILTKYGGVDRGK